MERQNQIALPRERGADTRQIKTTAIWNELQHTASILHKCVETVLNGGNDTVMIHNDLVPLVDYCSLEPSIMHHESATNRTI